jgi:hypothetical protein
MPPQQKEKKHNACRLMALHFVGRPAEFRVFVPKSTILAVDNRGCCRRWVMGFLGMCDWYEQIDEPVRDLVRLLRDNGFNTTRSCGHLPQPYVQMDWVSDRQVTDLYNLLIVRYCQMLWMKILAQ